MAGRHAGAVVQIFDPERNTCQRPNRVAAFQLPIDGTSRLLGERPVDVHERDQNSIGLF